MRRIAGGNTIDKPKKMEELREEVSVKEESGEEPPKLCWTFGENGRGTIDEESDGAWSGG